MSLMPCNCRCCQERRSPEGIAMQKVLSSLTPSPELVELKAQNEKLSEDLASNVCGYCWRKMDKDAEPIGIEAENRMLKAELEQVIKIGVEGQREINRKLSEENKRLREAATVARDAIVKYNRSCVLSGWINERIYTAETSLNEALQGGASEPKRI